MLSYEEQRDASVENNDITEEDQAILEGVEICDVLRGNDQFECDETVEAHDDQNSETVNVKDEFIRIACAHGLKVDWRNRSKMMKQETADPNCKRSVAKERFKKRFHKALRLQGISFDVNK